MAVGIEVQDEVIEVTSREEQAPVHVEQSVMKGDKGDPGASAYELAVANGFEGTEEEWIESLNGKGGEPGTSPTISVETITGGRRITITDVNGTKTVDIMDAAMTPEDKAKLDEIEAGAEVNVITKVEFAGGGDGGLIRFTDVDGKQYNTFDVDSLDMDDFPLATSTKKGIMSPEDKTKLDALVVGEAEAKMSEHNTNKAAHNDIRLLIEGLTTRLNALANSDDTTLDQFAEVVAYIKANRTLIESVTTSKVNVTDIINNLTTNVTNKPLSAAQGVALKNLIDDINEEISLIINAAKDYVDSAYVTHLLQSYTPYEEFLIETSKLSNSVGDKVDKTGITLGEHTDGLVYVFINGTPTGNGIEMGSTGDVIGIVDSEKTLVLTGDLADGAYTIVYVDKEGNRTPISGFTLGETAEPELFVPATCLLNKRLNSSGELKDQDSTFVTDFIDIGDLPIGETRDILFSGFQIQMGRSGSPYTGIELYGADKVRRAKGATEYNDAIEYDTSGRKTFKATVNNPSTSTAIRYIKVYGHLGETYDERGATAISSIDELANCSLILA